MKKIFILCLLFFVTCLLFSNSDYDSGYKSGFDEGYKNGFIRGKNEGITSGNIDGEKKGYRDGKSFIQKPFKIIDYGINIESLGDENYNRTISNSSFENGYEKGKRDGYREGYFIGYKEGLKLAYQHSYEVAFEDGKKEAYTELFLDENLHKMSDIQQFEKYLSYYKDKKYLSALMHLNVIITQMNESKLRMRALFRVSEIHLILGNKKNSCQAYLRCIEDYRYSKEVYTVILSCIRVLKDLVTNGYYGLSKNTFYNKTIELSKIIIDESQRPDYITESCFIAGNCYERIHNINFALQMYNIIIDNYPNSIYFEESKNRIDSLGY